jgi:hypothetical protein
MTMELPLWQELQRRRMPIIEALRLMSLIFIGKFLVIVNYWNRRLRPLFHVVDSGLPEIVGERPLIP